jgi:hypothetical protein
MKKLVLFSLLALVSGGILFAQTATPASAINGTLGLNNGAIVLKSGDMTYYPRGLGRYVGFIDGLKDGAQVTIEGYVSAPSLEGQTERLLFPVKLTVNGKVYEVGQPMDAYPGAARSSRRGRGGSPGRGRR